ncbi:MAG: flagellin-like protein [Oscillospiraceae bacterium]|jgi:flagellin-like protein|nr:flagellin-like protein [Oscillospiraceae bacterium]
MSSNSVRLLPVTLRARLRDFVTREEGEVNIVAIVVLIGIALVLAVLFRNQIKDLLDKLFKSINANADSAVSAMS